MFSSQGAEAHHTQKPIPPLLEGPTSCHHARPTPKTEFHARRPVIAEVEMRAPISLIAISQAVTTPTTQVSCRTTRHCSKNGTSIARGILSRTAPLDISSESAHIARATSHQGPPRILLCIALHRNIINLFLSVCVFRSSLPARILCSTCLAPGRTKHPGNLHSVKSMQLRDQKAIKKTCSTRERERPWPITLPYHPFRSDRANLTHGPRIGALASWLTKQEPRSRSRTGGRDRPLYILL